MKRKKMARKKTGTGRRKKSPARKRPARKKLKKAERIGKRELSGYKRLLLRQREQIMGEIQHIAKDTLNKSQKDASGDISAYTYHMADVATDTYDREFSLGLASSEREILYDINEALKRMEDGSYGACLECGKGIPKKRLKAIPHAKHCIKCQQALETESGSRQQPE